MAEPPSIFAIFTDYDLDIKYLLKATFIRYCYKQHNICRVENKRLFLAKKGKYRNLHSTIQNKTLIQSEIYLQHHEQNAGRKRDTDQIQHLEKKNSNPLHLQIDFSGKQPHCGLL